MTGPRASAAERHLRRLLRRVGVSEAEPPDEAGWSAFLDATTSLLGDLDQDRYLLEQSLDVSSAEMAEMHAELRAQADQLAAEREELRRTNSLLEATLESTADAILVVGRDGRVSGYNARFAEMWGIPPRTMVLSSAHRTMRDVLDRVQNPASFMATLYEVQASPESASHDVVVFKDGRVVERDSLPQRIDGETVGRVWSFRDVTEQRCLQEELAHQAFHDVLTGLANRALFADHVTQAIRRRGRMGGHVAVIVADLDGFKNVNDSLGHAAGDALLVAVGERLRAALRDIDTVARLGGDEFAVVVDCLDSPEDVARLGERILRAIAAPFPVEGREVTVGISVGIAVVASSDETADSVLANADTAMYRAKRDGKNCYRIFESWMHAKAVERLELEQALRTASRDGSLVVHYQPVVGGATGRVECFEALARWYPDGRAAVTPDVFIPIAEESGLIVELGRDILFAACSQARRWRDAAGDDAPCVAVNVSRRQLVDPRFPADVEAALARAGLAPTSLVLEVTESVIGSDTGTVVAVLEEIRASGVRVAIDDFGTGYSSFAALADLPIDMLKIDKRFIDNVLDPGAGQGVVEAIARLAHTLRLSTTAEGVERPEQLRVLQELGCDRIQGFLYSRPLTEDQALAYLVDDPDVLTATTPELSARPG